MFGFFLLALAAAYIAHPVVWYGDSLYVNMTVGLDAVPMVLDTGSEIFLVRQNLVSLTDEYIRSNSSFAISYLSTSVFNVSLVIGAVESLANFTFAVPVDDTELPYTGILGVGPSRYAIIENIVDAFADQNVTSSSVLSINSHGSVVFGGVESVVDSLHRAPIRLIDGEYSKVALLVSSVSLGGVTVSQQKTIYEMDTGCEGVVVPSKVYSNIVALFSDTQYVDDNLYVLADEVNSFNITFDIGGVPITFPFLDIIDSHLESDPSYVSLKLAGMEAGDVLFQLSSSVLKHYYLVVDYDNREVLFAPFDRTEGTYLDVTDTFPIPATRVPRYDEPVTSDTSEVSVCRRVRH